MGVRESISILASKDAKLKDNVNLWFGDGANGYNGDVGDVKLRWDGTDLDLLPTADDSIFKIGNGTLNFDVWLFGADANTYASWDASASVLKLEDNAELNFGSTTAGPGTKGDVQMRFDGTDFDVLGASNGLIIKFGNGTNDFDLWFYGSSATNYLWWDSSGNNLSFQGNAGLLSMGTLSSANDTSGIALSASTTSALKICADTGGSALGAGNARATLNRFLIGTAITGGANASAYGSENLLKHIVSDNSGGNEAGVLGHFESAGTLTLTGSQNTVRAGVASFMDLAAGATVAAGTIISAFGVNPANFGSNSGRAAVLHVTAPVAGTWNAFAEISSVTDCVQDSAAGSGGHKYLKIYLNNVLYTIDMVTA